ncbi:conserved phage C-terminal domain-containing protein [Serratia fonticola]|uniref:conserved phage C-terminal domain-containing protein n=1 Tax=Serratia fonticola TaxID=47917 RepID=UPI00093E1C6A|nr:conserved phage C-terminal domain-containing protein [Serratia fonticola]OKP30951.1 GntR family transcriptional regulator [Serratia fonticola]
MSTKLTAYVWDGCAAAGMKLSMVAIMARLADFSSDEGLCWPSTKTIARQIGASESTVSAALAKLVEEGWISRQQRRKGNRNTSSMTQLNVEKLRAAANFHPPESDTSKSDTSKFDTSKSDPSESGKNEAFDPPESGYDPSVNSKQDPSDKNPCQSAEPTDDMAPPDELVLNHFNRATNSGYRDGKTTMGYIRGRLAEDYTAADLILIVDYLTAKWLNDAKMSDYLRPKTLFGPENCAEYFEKAKKWRECGRPACVDGKWLKPGQSADTGGNTERDAAYRRFIGSSLPLKSPGKLEQLVRTEASNAGVRAMQPGFSVNAWNRIWADCEQRINGGKAA